MTKNTFQTNTPSLSEITAYLSEKASYLLLIHLNPDPDALGSAIGLRDLIHAAGGNARIGCTDKIPERLAFMAEEITVLTPEEAMAASAEENIRIVLIDVASPMQLGTLSDLAEKADLIIDHHSTNQYLAPCYNTGAAATGENIWEIGCEMKKRGVLPAFSKTFCNAVYAAISADTGCFRYSSVTKHTHMIAAELIKCGTNHGEINHNLFECRTPKELEAEKYVLSNLRFFDNSKIALVLFTAKDMEKQGFSKEDTDNAVNIARSVRGVEVAATLKQDAANPTVYKVSMRSFSKDVASVCKKFGGGGHLRAAGCSVEAASPEEAIRTVLRAIEEVI